jgi:transcriptional regulator GlxA family with amidase domain
MTATNGTPGKVFILAYDDCDQLDVTGPLEILSTLVQWLGVQLDLRIVSIPSTTKDPSGMVRAANGLRFQSDPWDGCELPDVLIVAGGIFVDPQNPAKPAGIGLLKTDPNFTDKIAKQHASGRTVTSVCTGAFGVVGARVAAGRTITTHPGVLQNLRDFAGELGEPVTVIAPDPTAPEPNARVVQDGNLVTCGGVTSGIDEALYLVEKFWPDQLEGVRDFVDYHYTFKSLVVPPQTAY